MVMTKLPASKSEAAIFGRMIKADQGTLSRQLARFILTLGFEESDQARMSELAEKNQHGMIAPPEWDELMSYVRAGHLLALLQAKARKSLK